MNSIFIIMGVSGSGKTTVGKLLAEQTGMDFYDADDFHPSENISKMSRGIALDHEDRLPWLHRLNEFLKQEIIRGNIILACSALREEYRQLLSAQLEDRTGFIYLYGDLETISQRLENRQGHFMKPDLLQSQFDILEPPKNALNLDIKETPAKLVQEIINKFEMRIR